MAYLDLFESWGEIDYIYERFEPAFLFILNVCHFFNTTPVFYFSLLSFLQIVFIYIAFKDKKEILAYAMLFCILSGLAMGGFMNVIRQSIAFSIFVMSIKYIDERKPIKYFLFITFALLFHKSSLVLYPLYFLFLPKTNFLSNKNIQFLILTLSVVLCQLNVMNILVSYLDRIIIFMGYEDYIGTSFIEGHSELGIMDVFQLLIYYILIYFYDKVNNYFEGDNSFKLLYYLFFLGICLNYIFYGSMVFGRILSYFTNLSFIIMGYYLVYFIHNYKKSYNNFISFIIICLFMSLTYVRVLYYSKDNIIDYVTYYQKELHDQKELRLIEFKNRRL